MTVACGEEAITAPEPLRLRVVTFNTGTSPGQAHDAPPDDGYTSIEAAISDEHYGDGLAWQAVIDDTRASLAALDADVLAFQEIFFSGDCAMIPPQFHPGFVCDGWQVGDPTVAEIIAGAGYQVACHTGKSDKCVAVKRSFGTLRGCDADFCLEGLAGTDVAGCGRGARVGRGVIDLTSGGTLTVVNVHGTSGFTRADVECRTQQFRQAFADLPASPVIVLGDFNTDPGRVASVDPSARALLDEVERDGRFHFVSPVGEDVAPTYQGIFNIDHIISDSLMGECFVPGLTAGRPAATSIVYFDHKPITCDLREH